MASSPADHQTGNRLPPPENKVEVIVPHAGPRPPVPNDHFKLIPVVAGLNHKTAPVKIRECLAFADDEIHRMTETLRRHPDIAEIIIVSTCNRVELIMGVGHAGRAVQAAKQYLAEKKKTPLDRFEGMLYVHEGDDAVRHIFKVAASLDSMMVGEPQILGQMKSAYLSATRNKSSGVLLNRLMHRTFFVAKRIRTETGIGDHAVSVSYAAVELSKKIFGRLEGKKVLLVGAGEMAELALEHLIRQHVGKIFVANRTLSNGLALAKKFKGQAVHMEEMPAMLELVDIVIGSTGSAGHVITRKQVKNVIRSRRNRPLFFIDIAVPRDIDPAINRLTNCYVYDIDDLKGIVDQNISDRRQEAAKAERIIDEAVIRFRQWMDNLDVVPTIKALRGKIESIVDMEIDRTLNSLEHLSDTDREALGRMKTALVGKILHDPARFLKNNGCRTDRSVYNDITRRLFHLDKEKETE